MAFFRSLLLISCFFIICKSANILYVMPFISTSHYIMLRPIGLELARRGHNVTVITVHKEKNPQKNYHEIFLDDINILNLIGGESPKVSEMASLSTGELYEKFLWPGGLAVTEVILNSTQVQQFLAIDQKFDLVICEQFFQEATYILAHKYKAPLTLVSTFGNCMRHNIVTRNPLQLATVNQEYLDLKDSTSFWGRLRNFYFTVYEFIWWKYWYLEKQEQLVQKYVKHLIKPVPSLYEMQKQASLMLINSHYSFNSPTAYLPNIVEIGGIHLINSDGELPQDLKILLDQAKHGVVYVNFGSNLRSSALPIDKKNAFLNVFRRLSQTVLWKWEEDNLKNKPPNLETKTWMPQKEILAHPNVKLFISHGGLIGTQEAIFNGVPIIGMPIFADQYNNLLKVQERGFGKIMHYNDINEKNLESAILEVLNNDTYKYKALEISKRFKDRPMTPLDTSIFWLEYIIRNNNSESMKNPAADLNWLAYLMIDVYAFIMFVVVTFLFLVIKIIRKLKSMLVNKRIVIIEKKVK